MKPLYKLALWSILSFYLSNFCNAQAFRVTVGSTITTHLVGETVWVDCNATSISVVLPYYQYEIDPANQPQIEWEATPNFNLTVGDLKWVIGLSTTSDKSDGYVRFQGLSGGWQYLYIKQQPSIPTVTATSNLCSPGQAGNFSANAIYGGPHPMSMVWETTGGLLVNGSTSYTAGNTSSSTVPIQHNSYGEYQVKGIIPACNNLQGYTRKSYVGTPSSSDLSIQSSSTTSDLCISGLYSFYSSIDFGPNYSYSWSIPTGANSVYYYTSGTGLQVSPNSPGGIIVRMTVTNTGCSQSSYTDRFYMMNNCYASMAIGPNPVSDQLTIRFSNIEDQAYSPRKVQLINEKQIVMKELSLHPFSDSKEITWSVKEFNRGIYYLKVIYNEKKVESTRLVLN